MILVLEYNVTYQVVLISTNQSINNVEYSLSKWFATTIINNRIRVTYE